MNTPRDLRTRAIVLRRTNYGEADRILNLIAPEGKLSAIAKGVRREKSKLAGGIEMFTLSELNIHQSKSDFGIITSARMLEHYSNILTSLERIELASKILKRINSASESIESPAFFNLTEQSLSALNQTSQNQGITSKLVEIWFTLNLNKLLGSELNLYRDSADHKLEPDKTYLYDATENAFTEHPAGPYSANEIKLLRLILTSPLSTVSRVKDLSTYLPKICDIIYLQ